MKEFTHLLRAISIGTPAYNEIIHVCTAQLTHDAYRFKLKKFDEACHVVE